MRPSAASAGRRLGYLRARNSRKFQPRPFVAASLRYCEPPCATQNERATNADAVRPRALPESARPPRITQRRHVNDALRGTAGGKPVASISSTVTRRSPAPAKYFRGHSPALGSRLGTALRRRASDSRPASQPTLARQVVDAVGVIRRCGEQCFRRGPWLR